MKRIVLVCLLLTAGAIEGFSQNGVFGKWKTIDDETGEAKSVVEIYECGDKVCGKIIKLFRKGSQNPDPICNECPEDDDRYSKKIIGMEIIRGLEEDEGEYEDGTVLKPDEGKIYKCKIWSEGDKLNVRGYWGLFYRTQTWERYTEE